MNIQDFSIINGFPLNQAALDRMQTAYSIFNALGSIAGDKTIISGCTLTGSTVSDGVVFVNGEVFEFRGGLAQTKVVIKQDVTNLVYKNGNSYPAVKTRYITFGTGIGEMLWSDFKRGFQTKDIAAGLLGKADQTSFDALTDAFVLVYEKMLTIETGAQKNVKTDWNAPSGDAQLLNKPNVITALHIDSIDISDIAGGTGDLRTVSFPNVGTSEYIVVGSLVSVGSDWGADNDVFWMIREKQNSSFKLALREVAEAGQLLKFEYMLIPK